MCVTCPRAPHYLCLGLRLLNVIILIHYVTMLFINIRCRLLHQKVDMRLYKLSICFCFLQFVWCLRSCSVQCVTSSNHVLLGRPCAAVVSNLSSNICSASWLLEPCRYVLHKLICVSIKMERWNYFSLIRRCVSSFETLSIHFMLNNLR